MIVLSLVLIIALTATLIHRRVPLAAGSVIFMIGWLLIGLLLSSCLLSLWLLLPLLAALILLNVPAIRQPFLSKPIFNLLQKTMPSMSVTEREAIEAGTTWWEKDLFSGAPDWQKFAQITAPALSSEEQSFLDNEVSEFCALLDEWDIHNERKDLSPEAWAYLKEKGFLSLIIPKEFGGKDFSAYAQSRVMSKIASRSITAAVTAMVPNSLGPGELLMKYGTDEQKNRWLPGLAAGTEIPCFGLTGPEAGSDAGSIPDKGIVCKGEFEGKEVLGLRLTFNKRWITLAPVATVVGLAFKLDDPEGLLGDPNKVEYGITCALLPANHPGVEIGQRHNPGSPFMNGPIKGENVFIPIDWIIGGAPMAGKGWRMLIECLSAGRGISLPALATASGEMCYRMVGAYSRVRRQFNTEIGKFEGVQEVTADIAAGAYTLEAMRHMVTKGLETGAPSVMTAMAKYHATEIMRRLVNHSMDVVGGRAIQMGPRNFLVFPYQSIPVAITVEGANILTRSLMIFGQGAIRCHPYLFDEMQAMQHKDGEQGLKEFDSLLVRHLGHVFGNLVRVVLYGITRGRLSKIPNSADRFSTRWFQRINLLSASLSVTSDFALAILGGDLKRREMLSGRLGDVLSQLFIASSLIKFHASHIRTPEEDLHADYALTQALHSGQEALLDFYANFPVRPIAWILKLLTFPLGRLVQKPADDQTRKLGDLMMENNPVRQHLGQFVYINTDSDDATGRVESTFQALLELGPVWQIFARAQQKGKLAGETLTERVNDAVEKGIISDADAPKIIAYDAKRYDCLLTDAFDQL